MKADPKKTLHEPIDAQLLEQLAGTKNNTTRILNNAYYFGVHVPKRKAQEKAQGKDKDLSFELFSNFYLEYFGYKTIPEREVTKKRESEGGLTNDSLLRFYNWMASEGKDRGQPVMTPKNFGIACLTALDSYLLQKGFILVDHRFYNLPLFPELPKTAQPKQDEVQIRFRSESGLEKEICTYAVGVLCSDIQERKAFLLHGKELEVSTQFVDRLEPPLSIANITGYKPLYGCKLKI